MQFTLWKQMYRSSFNPVITWAENIKKKKKSWTFVFISATANCAKVKLAVTLKNAPR